MTTIDVEFICFKVVGGTEEGNRKRSSTGIQVPHNERLELNLQLHLAISVVR